MKLLLILSLLPLLSYATTTDYKKWISRQKIDGYTFQFMTSKEHSRDGVQSALFYKGSKKITEKELVEDAKKMENVDPMSEEYMKNQRPFINLMVMDNRVRMKNGKRTQTAQNYLGADNSTKCTVKGAQCYFQDLGITKFVVLGVDKNVNVMLMASKHTTIKTLIEMAKKLNFAQLNTGAGAQTVAKNSKRPKKVIKIDENTFKGHEKEMKDMKKQLNKLKNLFGN